MLNVPPNTSFGPCRPRFTALIIFAENHGENGTAFVKERTNAKRAADFLRLLYHRGYCGKAAPNLTKKSPRFIGTLFKLFNYNLRRFAQKKPFIQNYFRDIIDIFWHD